MDGQRRLILHVNQHMVEQATSGRRNGRKVLGKQWGHPRADPAAMELSVSMEALTRQHNEVLKVVIEAVAVPMMNDFTGLKRAAQSLFSQQPVGQHPLPC